MFFKITAPMSFRSLPCYPAVSRDMPIVEVIGENMTFRALLLMAGLLANGALAQPTEGSSASAQTQPSSIGYPTVAAALEALRSQSGSTVSLQGGWSKSSVSHQSRPLWSFTPANHPAHPAAVKRKIVERDGVVGVHMTALCQAEKAACNRLIEEFQQLNDRIREQSQRRAESGAAGGAPK